MIWFQRLFPVAMLLWPVLFVAAMRPRFLAARTTDATGRPNTAGPARAGGAAGAVRGSRALAFATAVALLVQGGVQAWLESALPEEAFWRAAWPIFVAVLGSMLLWFVFAVPSLAVAARGPHDERPALGAASGAAAAAGDGAPLRAGPAVRAASLEPRERLDPVPRSAWTIGWIVFAVCTMALGWSLTRGAHSALLLGLGFWLFSGPVGARRSLLEAEPRDAAGSPALAEAYASLRRLKAWGFFWFGLLGTALFAGVAVVAVLAPQSGGLIGGLLGSAFGLGGGLFGAMASVRRARIQAQLAALAGSQPPASPPT